VSVNYTTLSNVPLLEGLQPEDLHILAPNIETRAYEKGETLFLKGDKGGALLIVVSGNIELFIFDENRSRIILSEVKEGGFFGEVSLFDNSLRTANAMATEPSSVLVLRQEIMVNFLRRHPDAAIHVINILSKRLRDTTTLVSSNKNGQAYAMLQEQRRLQIWDRIADKAATIVGSWPYLTLLVGGVILWVILNAIQLFGTWDRGPEFNVLNLTLTILGALQVPLILMSQRRQDDFERIAADLDYQVNLKAQLSILEVTRKLDWLQEAMLEQMNRLQSLESSHFTPHQMPVNKTTLEFNAPILVDAEPSAQHAIAEPHHPEKENGSH
jgi:CRP/FNR family cyclic AMP-dependent transcriptional regulator